MALVVLGLWLGNSSLLVRSHAGRTKLLAHRGVHQHFDPNGMRGDDCAARRIGPPTHDLLENTLPSMAAAFEAGADVVELDVHLTPDDELAVFHDWTTDCVTGTHGVTHEMPMGVLRTLDLGYGYSADGGKTYPFRGKSDARMPTLAEVLQHFSSGKFLVDFKSGHAKVGLAVANLMSRGASYRGAVWGVYGGEAPTETARALHPGLRGYTRASVQACGLMYIAVGWTGYVPEACRHRIVLVPANLGPLMWGWPHRFVSRMHAADSEVILANDYESGAGTRGFEDPASFDARVPEHFDGYVWTNRIELIGPHLRKRGEKAGQR